MLKKRRGEFPFNDETEFLLLQRTGVPGDYPVNFMKESRRPTGMLNG